MKQLATILSSFLLLAPAWGAPSLIEAGTFVHLRDTDEQGEQEDYYIRADAIDAVVVFPEKVDDKTVYHLRLVTRMLEIRESSKNAATVSKDYEFTCSNRGEAQKLAAAITKAISARARSDGAEQSGPEPPATRPESKPEGRDKPQPSSGDRSR